MGAPMRRGGSRLLILVLILAAAGLALAPVFFARGHGVQVMREELEAALSECRARYAEARTAADTTRADQWVPNGSAGLRAGDPPCGKYRRRNMLGRAS
jgi:type II secretory pathway pseudopilin PulG